MNKEYLEVNGDSTNVTHFLIFEQRMLQPTVWFVQEQAAKEALAAELVARGVDVEEGKKKVRNAFVQSNFPVHYTFAYHFMLGGMIIGGCFEHRNEDVMKTPRAQNLLKHQQQQHTTC